MHNKLFNFFVNLSYAYLDFLYKKNTQAYHNKDGGDLQLILSLLIHVYGSTMQKDYNFTLNSQLTEVGIFRVLIQCIY
jgi:hypothetical protein